MEDRSKRLERIEFLEETSTLPEVSNYHSQPSLNILHLSSLLRSPQSTYPPQSSTPVNILAFPLPLTPRPEIGHNFLLSTTRGFVGH